MEQATTNVQVQPVDKAKIWGIWKVALILAVVTGIEYVFAFQMEAGALRNVIFIGLTIVKAFYIVAEFMHLGHEVKGLVYSIILPMIFILWLIMALVNLEGAAIKDARGIVDYEGDGIEHVDEGH
ncbi:MAG: cytochrome C oxidase subunit IV family protein [Roseivirga sp.]|uniref:cytochrome C oxidase subunit IV family protein n=1 Tax=Roseivirga sp. TaxID=1964215 RepID=UPI001B039849|nr:cytochrome C oxidase subunit IV family protein [Roseivirga sp.]MBO6659246.1 cytochrome C oxidase subunit IV family protein [Roseivirga sp.]MBO6761853.1 cytochrome C oxidase subunit IV family protein [Roseivirga sp.]MBO6908017.1 cytochrome C oxidase subunit IV family protein [Roseivirga sp.]